MKTVFKDLKVIQAVNSKVRDSAYSKFSIQHYMTSPLFTNKMVEILFNMRSSMTRGIQNNFPSLCRENMRCKLECPDLDAIDCQEHLLSCKSLISRLSIEQQVPLKDIKYSNIFGSTEEQHKIVEIFSCLLEIRGNLLESQPVGLCIGPSMTVTPT